MSNAINSITKQSESALLQLEREIYEERKYNHQEHIKADSPYSDEINTLIDSYDELKLYVTLNLKEAEVTRRALIKEIDMDLWVSSKSKTNRELMKAGQSPYAYDSEEGCIELHHIGQQYTSPFAELTTQEHNLYGQHNLLHSNKEVSWRNDKKLTNKFLSEKQRYWQKRANGNITLLPEKISNVDNETSIKISEDTSNKIISAIETLMQECSPEDLGYIRDLADSYSLIKQVGASSISEYVNKSKGKGGSEAVSCTFCGSKSYVLYGSYLSTGEKIKRYRCKKCQRTFTMVHDSIISGSNLSFVGWLKMIDCLYNGYSLSKTAKICNISEQAAQENRYKLFYALKLLDDQIQLKGNIVIDETYFATSYKGNYLVDEKPRKSHKRGHDDSTPGTSKNKVCVVCALDDKGLAVARVSGCGTSSTFGLCHTLEGAITKENTTCLYADEERAIGAYARKNDLPIKQSKFFKSNKCKISYQAKNSDVFVVNNYLQHINSYHSRLKNFMRRYNGLSSKYLSGYLYLFNWKERNKDRDACEAFHELLQVLTEPNCRVSVKDISAGRCLPDPFILQKQVKLRHNKKKAEIYRLYANGMNMNQVARVFGVYPQYIHKVIREYRESGLAYKTVKEIEHERKILEVKEKPYKRVVYKRLLEIYELRKQWDGKSNDFIKLICKKYKLKPQTVKNGLCTAQRIIALREAFYINETHPFSSMQELYQKIYEQYKNLEGNKTQRANILAKEFNFTPNNIRRIVNIMSANNGQFIPNRQKLSIQDTLNRDRSVFIDFLKWDGSRPNFLIWASEKYNISTQLISNIIGLCLDADPARRDMV